MCVKSVFGQQERGLETTPALAVTQTEKALRSTAGSSPFICFATVEHSSEDDAGMKGGKDNGDVVTGFQRDRGWCRPERLTPPTQTDRKLHWGKDQQGFCTENPCLPNLIRLYRRLFEDDDAHKNKQDSANFPEVCDKLLFQSLLKNYIVMG